MAKLTVHGKNRITEISFSGEKRLAELLDEAGFPMDSPCGRRGTCGACGVEIQGAVNPPDAYEIRAGHRLACRAVLLGDAEVTVREHRDTHAVGKKDVIPRKAESPVIGVADLGTTTVVADFYDEEGTLLASASADNPQQSVAADVIGRIAASIAGRREELKEMAQGCLHRLAEQSGMRCSLTRWIVTGNTAMLTLLAGFDAVSLSRAPFRADCLFDETIMLDGVPAFLPPCLHAFLGADALCALLFSGMAGAEGPRLLCDVGTNGEILLWNGTEGKAVSVATGPAMEGAGIRHGSRGIPGAIDRVTALDGRLICETIGGERAVGVCGSGLLDAAASALSLNLIRADGFLEEPLALRDGIALYPEDIRQLQLAKAAMAAGINTLLDKSGIALRDVRELLLCGGFGSRLNPISAARIGMIPSALLPVARPLGNAALAGAAMLRGEENIREIRRLRERTAYVPLGGDEAFNRAFLRHMSFP